MCCVSAANQAPAQNVALALEPRYSERPRIETRIVTENLLGELDLLEFDCIFLCNVGRFRRDEVGLLHAVLQSGRGLVFFLGDQVQPENYNLELGGELDHPRILPARLAALAPTNTYLFDPQDYRHPIVSPFVVKNVPDCSRHPSGGTSGSCPFPTVRRGSRSVVQQRGPSNSGRTDRPGTFDFGRHRRLG